MPNKKTALVYGGRSPIALELCRQLYDSGQETHLVTRNRDKTIIELAKLHKCKKVYECNLEDSRKSVSLALEINERVGGLTSISFVHRYRSDQSDSLKQYQVEVDTPFRIIEALAGQDRTRQLAIAVFTSPGSHHVLGDQSFQYHASKAALSQLVRFASVRFASNNIRINGISPGSLIFKQRAAAFYRENPKIVERANRLIPLGRMGTVGEIASVTVAVLSESFSYLNGQVLEIDGGTMNIEIGARKDF